MLVFEITTKFQLVNGKDKVSKFRLSAKSVEDALKIATKPAFPDGGFQVNPDRIVFVEQLTT